MYSLVVPVYKNEGSIPELIASLEGLNRRLGGHLEAVFVVDGSPDNSLALLRDRLPRARFRSDLYVLARNFGAFPAIAFGLEKATGPVFAVMSADLQEPPDLAERFFSALKTGPVDVVLGVRKGRQDPWLQRSLAALFWWGYRRLVQRAIPRGGVDVFGCNLKFRDCLVGLKESNTSLIGLIFWMGFRRAYVEYERQERKHGKSAWTFSGKLTYLMDSVFSFTDLPIRVLIGAGLAGLVASPLFGATFFFAALNCLGLGVVGSYAWRAYENTKARPRVIALDRMSFKGGRESEVSAVSIQSVENPGLA